MRDVRQDRRLHEPAAIRVDLHLAAGEHLGALRAGVVQVALHDVHLHLRGHRAYVDVVAVRLALAQALRELHQLLRQLRRDALVDVDSLHRGAGLPGVGERAPSELERGGVQLGVVQHDRGVLPAQLQHAGDHLLGRGDVHLAAGGDRPGEHDHVHTALDQLRADVSLAVHHLQKAARDPCLLEQSAQALGDERRELARLEHHAVPGHERHHHVAGRNRERIVPGRDDPDHTARIEPEVGLLVREHVEGNPLVPQQTLGLPREVPGEIRDREHLHEERLVEGLAVLAHEEVGDLVSPIEHQLLEPPQDLPAILDRPGRPILLGCPGRGRCLAHLRGACDADLPDEPAAARLVHGQRSVRGDRPLEWPRALRRTCGQRFRERFGHRAPPEENR